MVDINDFFLKVFLMHGRWWGWGWLFGFLFFFGLGFSSGGRFLLPLFSRLLLVLFLLLGSIGFGFNGLLLHSFVCGRRRGLDFGLRHFKTL